MRQKALLVLVLLGVLMVAYLKRVEIKQMFTGDANPGPGYPVPAIKTAPDASPEPKPEPAAVTDDTPPPDTAVTGQ